MTVSRRRFLRTASLASASLIIPTALGEMVARAAAGHPLRAEGYGPLIADPAGLLDLPAGFRYQAYSSALLGTEDDARFSRRLEDGSIVPALHDGMGSFQGPRGVTILVRNHEMEPGLVPGVAMGREPRYDPVGTGGTTTLWIDRDRKLLRSFASLAGTFRNCAGGITPWGTWLTAEECTYMPGPLDPTSHDQRPDVGAPHGFVFEVDSRAVGLVEPTPIRAMGRVYHEAVAVDPATGFVYQTEDRDDGLVYRFRPHIVSRGGKSPRQLAPGDLAKGGVLEALRIVERPGARTQNWTAGEDLIVAGVSHGVDWVAIEDAEPAIDMERNSDDETYVPLQRGPRTAPGSVRAQGFRSGAAQFARNEGMTCDRGSIYFCSTNGGSARAGQVWRLEPAARRLTLLFQPDERLLLEGPDNLVFGPHRDLIVCEDGKDDDHVVGITPRGTYYPIARNARGRSEFAGACFSHDSATMFLNIQNPGITFAVWGPWSRRKA